MTRCPFEDDNLVGNAVVTQRLIMIVWAALASKLRLDTENGT